MNARINTMIRCAYFISPIVDMEQLILNMFSKAHGAELTVMEDGEHWFHTDEQMRFLDNWIIKGRSIQ